MNKNTLQTFIRSNGYAWPGGYPCALLMADGEVIDAKSARENYRLIRRETGKDWTPVEVFVHWEGAPLYCAHSDRPIESAYGPSLKMNSNWRQNKTLHSSMAHPHVFKLENPK